MDPQLKAQLAETIYVATASGVDQAGDPSYNAPATRAARVVNVRDTVERKDGTILETTVAIITEAEIKLTDRVWLPGVDQTDATKARRPRYVEKAITERGALDFYRTKL
jgi:chitodextrinase